MRSDFNENSLHNNRTIINKFDYIKDFIDFVKYTPQNTNPNIIGSILDRDINGSINKAKEYTDSQRIAYEEYKQIARLDKDNPVSDTLIEEINENRIRITSTIKH